MLTSLARGVRRLNVRKWEKAVADGNVEQMFGMNIKQEGIEVLGDQVRAFHRLKDSGVEVGLFLQIE
jgi:hypothetical protein